MNSILYDLAIKGTIILMVTGVLSLALRRSSAAIRHLVWSLGMAGLVALPFLSKALPQWGLPVLPAEVPVSGGGVAPVAAGFPWMTAVLGAWMIGAAAVFGTIAFGRARVWWLKRSSLPLTSGPWPALVNRLSGEIGLGQRVELRQIDRPIMPMMWGVLRPVVLIPRAANEWPTELRRDVLLHELAHVKRQDYLTQLLSRVACALHWFNPLVWMAAGHLRVEREQACDDEVLGAGTCACDYADHLLAVARRLRPADSAMVAIGMASGSQFSDRLKALLDERRRRTLSRKLTFLTITAATLFVFPLATVTPEHVDLDLIAHAAEIEAVDPYILAPTPAMNARDAIEEAENSAKRKKVKVAGGEPKAVAMVPMPAIEVVLGPDAYEGSSVKIIMATEARLATVERRAQRVARKLELELSREHCEEEADAVVTRLSRSSYESTTP